MIWVRRILLTCCLLPAAVLTLLRFTQPPAGLAVRLVAFTPFALVLYAAALLLALVALFSPRTPRWQLPAFVAFVSLVGVVVHGTWLAPQFFGFREPVTSDADPFRVLTVNLDKGAADTASVVQEAALRDVDVLVVEEITPGALARLRKAGVNDLFPFSAGEPRQGVRGTMVFTVGLVSNVSRLPLAYDSWALTIALRPGPQRVFAVHGRPPVGDARGWRADLRVLADLVAAQRPDVVLGDFNATPDHRAFRRVLDAGLDDASESANAGWQPTWPAPGTAELLGIPLPPLVQIDHVLVGEDLKATSAATVSIERTDHKGVLAEILAR